MRSSCISLFAISFAATVTCSMSAHDYQKIYLEDYCSGARHLDIDDDYFSSAILLKGLKGGTYSEPLHCNVTLSASWDKLVSTGLIVTMEQIDLHHGFPSDSLRVSLDDQTVKYWSGATLDFDNPEFVSSDNEIAIELSTDAGSNKHDGFSFIVTSYKQFHKCPSNYFECELRKCIRSELVCDGQNNCGNERDEHYCFSIGIAGIITFIICIVTLIVCAGICQCILRRKIERTYQVRPRFNTDPSFLTRLPTTSPYSRARNYGTTSSSRWDKAPAYEAPPPYPGLARSLEIVLKS